MVGPDLVGNGLGVRPPLERDSGGGGTGPEGCAGEAEGVHGGLSCVQLMGVGLDGRFPGSVDVFRQWSEFGAAWRELQSCGISRERAGANCRPTFRHNLGRCTSELQYQVPVGFIEFQFKPTLNLTGQELIQGVSFGAYLYLSHVNNYFSFSNMHPNWE